MEHTNPTGATSQQFIRVFRGKHIMLFRDFEAITGVRLRGNYTSWKRKNRLMPGVDYNGWGWECDNEKFREEYGFDYGDDKCMMYLYCPHGIRKALNIYTQDGEKADIVQAVLDMVKAASTPSDGKGGLKVVAHQSNAEDERDRQIAQDFYDRLEAEDLTFREALSILEQASEKLKAEMYRRHINGLE